MVITSDGRWIYGYDPETKQLSTKRKLKSKVMSMLIIFFDMKGSVYKEFILAGQTVNSTYYRDILQ
jgi:hypothetical protein